MPWLLVDLALVLLAVVALALVGLRLWRGVTALTRELAAAGEAVGAASAELARLQEQPVPGGGSHAASRSPRSPAHGASSRVR